MRLPVAACAAASRCLIASIAPWFCSAFRPSEAASIHASIALPPQVLSTMPIGTPVLARNSFAKK